MTVNELIKAIKESYLYAHAHCIYAPSNDSYPPMSDGKADCVALVLRALWTLGINKRNRNIDEVIGLCQLAQMKQSFDINDVYKYSGVVCMCPKNDRSHVSHVYFSLGGKSLNDISKFDLGSNERIKAEQPFTHCKINEWEDRFSFLTFFYVETKYSDVPYMDIKEGKTAIIKTETGLYSGPGTAWRKIKTLSRGVRLIAYNAYVTNDSGNKFRYVETSDGKRGFVYHKSIDVPYFEPYSATVKGTDGKLSIRCGAGVECHKIGDVKEGKDVMVWAECFDNVGNIWANISYRKIHGFVNIAYLSN